LAVGLQRRLGLELDQASRDGRWALERVSCLGACGQAPVMVLDGELFSAPLADQPQALDRWLTALGLPAGLGTT
jgi:NADH:ubiquinone oxidoreductase subunit E